MVPRELGYVLQSSLDIHTRWYVDDGGRLNMTKLLTAFSTFFGEHAEHWLGQLGAYREAAPQLILQSYLQRVVNSGGRIKREYGLGRGRTDLLVLWPREAGQPSDLWERFVVECKVLRDTDRKSLARTVECGVEQTLGYMAQCGAEEGHLVVMDRRSEERRRGEERRRRGGPPGRRGRGGWRRTPPERARGGGLDAVAHRPAILPNPWTETEGGTIREAAPPSGRHRALGLTAPAPADAVAARYVEDRRRAQSKQSGAPGSWRSLVVVWSTPFDRLGAADEHGRLRMSTTATA